MKKQCQIYASTFRKQYTQVMETVKLNIERGKSNTAQRLKKVLKEPWETDTQQYSAQQGFKE